MAPDKETTTRTQKHYDNYNNYTAQRIIEKRMNINRICQHCGKLVTVNSNRFHISSNCIFTIRY